MHAAADAEDARLFAARDHDRLLAKYLPVVQTIVASASVVIHLFAFSRRMRAISSCSVGCIGLPHCDVPATNVQKRSSVLAERDTYPGRRASATIRSDTNGPDSTLGIKLAGPSAPRAFRDLPTLDALAAEQGIEPVERIEELADGTWPEDESVDEFLAAIESRG